MTKIVCERYEVREPIGTGAMGTVYRGWDIDSQLPVAVKILHANATEADPMAIERFLREGLLVQQLNHPNIIKVFTTTQDNEEYVMVMELVEGVTLRHYIDTHAKLPITRRPYLKRCAGPNPRHHCRSPRHQAAKCAD